jgi:HNH endonuclease
VSVTYIPAQLRRAVLHRADWLCEYCLIHEDDTFLGCQVDHIIAEKHGGITDFTNLALACTNCNRAKGSDIATLVDEDLVRLFNPRLDSWSEHFELAYDGMTIMPRSLIGRATTRILALNTSDRLFEREALRDASRYPSPQAQKRMNL